MYANFNYYHNKNSFLIMFFFSKYNRRNKNRDFYNLYKTFFKLTNNHESLQTDVNTINCPIPAKY